MKNYFVVVLGLILSACVHTGTEVRSTKIDGLSFATFDGQAVAVFKDIEELEIAYSDRSASEIRAFSVIPDIRDANSSAAGQGENETAPTGLVANETITPLLSPIGPGSGVSTIVETQIGRLIIALYPPSPTPILICEVTHNPCTLNGTLGCGGGFALGVGESIKELLARIIADTDSGSECENSIDPVDDA